MDPRTCPECHYKYSQLKYIKDLSFKITSSKWNCPQCNCQLTFDINRRTYLAIYFGAYLFLLIMLKAFIRKNALLWAVFGVFLLAGTLYIYSFDRFKKVDKGAK